VSRIVQPRAIGGRETQCPCVIVGDCDGALRAAKAAGADIVDALETKTTAGWLQLPRHRRALWWFGSYDPWAPESSDFAGIPSPAAREVLGLLRSILR